jgi:hypothetical protein
MPKEKGGPSKKFKTKKNLIGQEAQGQKKETKQSYIA